MPDYIDLDLFPDNCPPPDSFKPDEITYYRFSSNPESCEDDFISYKRHGKQCYDDCIGCALSIFSSFEACKKARRLARLRKYYIMKLDLTPNDGTLKQTGQVYHFSWWRLNDFDVLNVPVIEFTHE